MKPAKCVNKKARKSSRYRSLHRMVPSYNRSYGPMPLPAMSDFRMMGILRNLFSRKAQALKTACHNRSGWRPEFYKRQYTD